MHLHEDRQTDGRASGFQMHRRNKQRQMEQQPAAAAAATAVQAFDVFCCCCYYVAASFDLCLGSCEAAATYGKLNQQFASCFNSLSVSFLPSFPPSFLASFGN